MTKPKHNRLLSVTVLCITVIIFSMASSIVKGETLSFYGGVLMLPVTFNKNEINFSDTTGIIYPEDILTYTDLNSCESYISSGLRIIDSNNTIIVLTWKMLGATKGASPNSGINQLNAYSFNEGTTLINYRGKDKFNNPIDHTFKVIVSDNQVPMLQNSLEDIVKSADPKDCYATVNWESLIVSDNCTPRDEMIVSFSHTSGSFFPVGTTNVEYRISDGMDYNNSKYGFTITVTDDEVPEIIAPQPVSLKCGDIVPDAFVTWQQFFDGGGMAFDNCNIDYSSFKFINQKSSGIRCPYTITRTYSIADGYGNISEVEHLIYVDEDTEEKVILKSTAGAATVSVTLVEKIDVTCLGGNNGSVNLDTASTNGPITSILWSNGATSLDVSGLTAGSYSVTITDGDGAQNFGPYVISQPSNPLTITSQPSDIIECEGSIASFSVNTANAVGSVSYTWQRKLPSESVFTNVPAHPNFTYPSPNELRTENVGNFNSPDETEFRVVATDDCGSITSSEAILEVNEITAIENSTSPDNATEIDLCAGDNFSLTVETSGETPVSYQWRKYISPNNWGIVTNNAVISGAQSNQLSFSSITGAESGSYKVIVEFPSSGANCNVSSDTREREIIVDEEKPIPQCKNATTYLDNTGNASINTVAIDNGSTDNCAIDNLSLSVSNFNCTNLGNNAVTLTVIDSNGNDSTCTASVSVLDTVSPLIACPADINENTAGNSCDKGITLQAPTYSDNCSISSLTWSITGATTGTSAATGINTVPNNYKFNSGTSTVSYTASDASGNSVSCSFQVKVTDNHVPEIANCPADITSYTQDGDSTNCNQTVSWTEPTATDNCTNEANLVWTKSHNPSSSFSVGTTVVTYIVSDAANNKDTCSFNVVVVDNTRPTFNAPGDITITASSSCMVNRDPVQTGNVTSANDNCTISANLVTNYTDEANIEGSCIGNYSFIRTWEVTDEAGNSRSKTQTIYVEDKEKPVISVPGTISISCDQDTSPAGTGWATATDNCSPTDSIQITYSDVLEDGVCSGNYKITRTWFAVDDCGNAATPKTQIINVSDNTPPLITAASNISVSCPDDIPTEYLTLAAFLSSGGSVTDNCTDSISFAYVEEVAYGLEDAAGYCPDSVVRTYRFTDRCGNYTDFKQTTVVAGSCGCSPCTEGVPFFWIDMLGRPDMDTTIYRVRREEKCCGATRRDRCVAFNIRLDDDAVGVEISIDGATPQPHEWNVGCNSVTIDNGIVCIPGGKFQLFTFCKPGANRNDYTIRSVKGIVASDDVKTRVQCGRELVAEGSITNPVWTSIYPGNVGDYDSYLSTTTDTVTFFNPPSGAPPEIRYQICGTPGSSVCTSPSGNICDTITIYVKDSIGLDLNINPDVVCEDIQPLIIPDISPAGDYSFQWFSGSNASGTLLSSDNSYQPTAQGEYSIIVTDYTGDFPCSSDTFNFEITYDYTGPTVQTPPLPLTVQCNDPNVSQKIQDWLNSAIATYTDADGTLQEIIPNNNYGTGNAITMTCGDTVFVDFTAFDQCSNDSTKTSFITVVDTIPPTFNFCPPATNNIANNDVCHIVGFDVGTPTFSDDCNTPTLSWFKTGATTGNSTQSRLDSFNVGVTTITYVITDLCGNSDSCTQEITIYDEQEPNLITCPTDVIVTAPPPGCEVEVLTIDSIRAIDNCTGEELNLFWIKTNETGDTIATGTGYVNGTIFPSGITKVQYIVSDDYGNADTTCTFTVTVNDSVPPTILSCPSDINTTVTDSCELYVSVTPPSYTDPCGEIVDVRHNSPYTGANDSVADGIYPIGEHTITWTFTDVWGNDTTCIQTITITDNQPANLVCPDDFSSPADTLKDYATNVAIPLPTHSDNCPYQLYWVLKDTAGLVLDTSSNYTVQDTNLIPTPYPQNLYVGDNVFTYTLIDVDSNMVTCSFIVTIESKPVINCPNDTVVYAGDTVCTNTFNPGVPELLQGSLPITWNWEITGATMPSPNTGTFVGSLPPDLGEIDFELGVTTISWTASNVSGVDTCSHYIQVIDTVSPTILSLDSLADCVEPIQMAVYNPAEEDLYYPDRPDYLLFEAGDTTLNLQIIDKGDNCSLGNCPDSIRWQIEFSEITDQNGVTYTPATITGSGQLSEYGTDILFPGDGTYMTDVEHWISYWLTDCNGNTSLAVRRKVIVTPRPKIEKRNLIE